MQQLVTVETEDRGVFDPDHYLRERYIERDPQRLLAPYYALKPLMPRRLQIALRRQHARRRAQREFPAWPVEDLLVRHQDDDFRARIHANGGDPVPFVGFWPGGRRFAFVLTHDVEGTKGIENIPRVREVERAHGMVSSWNFVAEDYEIPDGVFADLRAEACEVGLHGLHHDWKLFSSRERFEQSLPAIRRYLDEWDAVGFRSPVTYRNAEWMSHLGALYDSSFPDTDPFEPMAGGCCSIFPFFIDDIVELPITLVQDHTMWEILREPGIDLWLDKTAWIRDRHGLVNVIVHPDYVLSEERLGHYYRFLERLAAYSDGWHARPRDVAAWWRDRAEMEVSGDATSVTGAGEWDARVGWAREDQGSVVYEA